MTILSHRRTQRGAALVVAMLLLLVLTILAISSMNSATLEFVMAGNEQFHQNAFQAAEAGIADALANASLNPDPGLPPLARAGSTSAHDSYTSQTTVQVNGQAFPADVGSNQSKFVTYHFEISSTGNSSRNAIATNIQGLQTPPVPADQTFHPLSGLGSSLTPPTP
jgi:type IV pilus assembly protein PilX